MQRQKHTPSKRTALSFIREVADQVGRTGSLRLKDIASLRGINQENTIIAAILQLGYLTEKHISEVTGIDRGLSKILQDLCENDLLRCRKISGVVIYWVRPEGVYRVPEIFVPGFGVVDLTKYPDYVSKFCSTGVSKRVSMPHLLACSDLAVRLCLATNGTVLGDRAARMVERVYNHGKKKRKRIGLTVKGHKVDLVVVSPLGEMTIYEVELSSHSAGKANQVCLDLTTSPHVKMAVYITDTQTLAEEVERRFAWVKKKFPKRAAALRKCMVVQCKGGRPPAISQIMPAGTSRS